MIVYNQKLFWLKNLCTVFAALTVLSNQFNIVVPDQKIRELLSFLSRYWQWSKPKPMYEKIEPWWDLNFPDKKCVFQEVSIIPKWKFVMMWLRYNNELYNDCVDNWVINKVPLDKKTIWWHACAVTFDWAMYTIIDNYNWSRTTIYKVSQEVWSWLLINKFIEPKYYRLSPTRVLWK